MWIFLFIFIMCCMRIVVIFLYVSVYFKWLWRMRYSGKYLCDLCGFVCDCDVEWMVSDGWWDIVCVDCDFDCVLLCVCEVCVLFIVLCVWNFLCDMYWVMVLGWRCCWVCWVFSVWVYWDVLNVFWGYGLCCLNMCVV